MPEFETVRFQHYLLYRENEIVRTSFEVFKPIKFSSDYKIDHSAPIHQIVDETKKGSLELLGRINLEFCRQYLVVFSADEFSSPFRSVGLTPARLFVRNIR